MSERAIVWAQGQVTRTSTQKFCLLRMAAYMDATGHGWALVEGPNGLAAEMQVSERHLYRCLRALETLGLIKRTGKFRGRNVPYYQMAVNGPLTPVSGLNPDLGVRVENATPDLSVRPTPDLGVRTKQGTPSSVEDKSSPSEGAGAGEGPVPGKTAQAWLAEISAAYPEAGKRGVSSDRLALPELAQELAEGADGAEILEAAGAYAADKSLWGASGKPKALHNFIKSGVWKGLKASAANGVRTAWVGPPEIRAAFVAALDEAAVQASLDPAAWDEATRTVTPRFGYAFDRLKHHVPEGVTLAHPKAVR